MGGNRGSDSMATGVEDERAGVISMSCDTGDGDRARGGEQERTEREV